MVFNRLSISKFAALLAGCLWLAGCQQPEATHLTEFEFPTELTADGQTWVMQAWGAQQDKRLAATFSKRRYLAGNPAFEGQRVVYADAGGNERCYWVTPSEGGCQWLYIEFKGTRASEPVEGVDAPFLKLVKKEQKHVNT